MRTNSEKLTSKNLPRNEKVNEVDQRILRRQQRAENKNNTRANETLTQEFFEGLNIV